MVYALFQAARWLCSFPSRMHRNLPGWQLNAVQQEKCAGQSRTFKSHWVYLTQEHSKCMQMLIDETVKRHVPLFPLSEESLQGKMVPTFWTITVSLISQEIIVLLWEGINHFQGTLYTVKMQCSVWVGIITRQTLHNVLAVHMVLPSGVLILRTVTQQAY